MADAQDSGSCVRKDVGVQLPPRPPHLTCEVRPRGSIRREIVGSTERARNLVAGRRLCRDSAGSIRAAGSEPEAGVDRTSDEEGTCHGGPSWDGAWRLPCWRTAQATPGRRLRRIPSGATARPTGATADPAGSSAVPTGATGTTSAEGAIEGMFDVGGHSLYLHCEGTEPPTILYLHGSIEDASIVAHANGEPYVDSLSDDHRVCVYDRRNVGASDIVDEAQLPEDMIDDIHTAPDVAGVEPPYVLLGASFGGMLSYLYLNTYADDVVGVVLLDAMFPDELGARAPVPTWGPVQGVRRRTGPGPGSRADQPLQGHPGGAAVHRSRTVDTGHLPRVDPRGIRGQRLRPPQVRRADQRPSSVDTSGGSILVVTFGSTRRTSWRSSSPIGSRGNFAA